jgi:uncharacterized membrane protein YdjX (TVP38/TMEM64 family)
LEISNAAKIIICSLLKQPVLLWETLLNNLNTPMLSSPTDFVQELVTSISAFHPLISAALFCALLTLCTISIVIPTTPINFALGALYGILPGAIITNVGCVLGSIINFLIGRYLARDWALKKINESKTLTSLDEALKEKSIKMIILARLSPVFPFAMVSF